MVIVGFAMGLAVLTIYVLASFPGPSAVGRNQIAQGMCIKTGEEMDGPVKVCHYSCGGRDFTITVRSTEMCPPYIQP